MKRHSRAFLLAAAVLVMTAAVSFADQSDEKPAEYGEKVKLYNERVYSIDEDTQKIYVSDGDAEKMQVFADAKDCSLEEIAIKDGYVYYYSFEKGGIVKVSLAEKKETLIGTDASDVLEFIVTEKNIYTIEKIKSSGNEKGALSICSRDLGGENMAVLLEGQFGNAKLRFCEGKLYFIDTNDYGAVHSYDIETQKNMMLSSTYADDFEIEDSKIYVLNKNGVGVMNLDGSAYEVITREDFSRIEVEGQCVYFMDGYEVYKYDCSDNTYKFLYKSDQNYIEGISASETGAYLVETTESRSGDVLDTEQNKLVRIEDGVDAAYMKDGVIYYENGKGLNSYDPKSSASRLIDAKADSIWRLDDNGLYYSAYEGGKVVGRFMDLQSGEIKTLEGMKGYPVGLFADESGIYYFEYDVENYDGVIYEDECSGLVKLNYDGLDKKFISPWFISYDADMKISNEDYIFYDTRKGIFRVDKENDSAKNLGYIGNLLGVADQTIYTYIREEDSVYAFSTDGENRRQIASGMGQAPFFDGRYFLLYDYEQNKIRMIDPQGSGERQADFDGEGVFFLESSNEDGIYLKSGGGLYFMDFSGLEVKKIADGDARKGQGENALISIERYSESKLIKKIAK